jgi:hypothetical protein
MRERQRRHEEGENGGHRSSFTHRSMTRVKHHMFSLQGSHQDVRRQPYI